MLCVLVALRCWRARLHCGCLPTYTYIILLTGGELVNGTSSSSLFNGFERRPPTQPGPKRKGGSRAERKGRGRPCSPGCLGAVRGALPIAG